MAEGGTGRGGGRKEKEDVEVESSLFEGVHKAVVLHDSNIFHQPVTSPGDACLILTRVLYLLIQGETFSQEESTKLFFGVTKLFQSSDVMLRRMVYLVIKELGRNNENVFIVINCLSKDMTSGNEVFQANAIRVLSKIIEVSLLGQMERFIKQAIVDKNAFVASSALVAGQNLFTKAPDIVRRWSNEIQEAVSSKSKMVQYHSLALLHAIKKHDRLSILKIVSSLAKKPPKSPLAHCLLIRYAVQALTTASASADEKSLIEFITSSLRHKSSMVMYEAARALCFLPVQYKANVAPAIAVLQEFLNSPIPSQRFCAVRTLNTIVTAFPLYVTPCTVDLELLINDQNRNIATLAITTLLKTGVESSIDRLMSSISSFMSEIQDELRIVLVDAIETLCFKFPARADLFLEFLSSILREEGGYLYKKTIVDAITHILSRIPNTTEVALEYLCDFIEDCEFSQLSVQVLSLLGDKGPQTKNPSRYIRYIFNRVILEQPRVRAAAVTALAQFASHCSALQVTVRKLLEGCLRDTDDEVRDRAVFYTSMFQRDVEVARTWSDFRISFFSTMTQTLRS
jgi:coatomer protein complex subunit gamma